MKAPKQSAPLSSFGNELLATLREGANRELKIKFDSKQLCTRFEQRIHQLRLAMKKQSAPGWENLYRCGVRKENNDMTLVIAPKDSEFRKFLAEAGVEGIDSPAPISEVEIATPAPGDADAFLATLVSATTIKPSSGDA